MANHEVAVHGAVSRVLAVRLTPDASGSSDSPAVHLHSLAQELTSENRQLFLGKDDLDRVLVARLIENPPDSYPQPPLQYILFCYSRASNELRSASSNRDPALGAVLQDVLLACKDLLVSYAGLLLVGGVVPQPPAAEQRGALQLLDSLDAQSTPKAGVCPLPPGFLDDLAAKSDADDLVNVVEPVAKELAKRAMSQSPLGDYAQPLSGIRQLVTVEPIARALVAARSWLPDLKALTGRAVHLAGTCWLGPFMSISSMPDPLILQQPSIRDQCFSNYQSRRQGDIMKSMQSLRMAQKQIVGDLHAIIKTLLGKNTRDAMMGWLAAVLEGNGERAKMQMNPALAASHGFFLNLDAVLLKFCGPFLDPSSPNFWKRVDARYVTDNPHISFAGETKLAASVEEEAAWRERVRTSSEASSSGASGTSGEGYHFICECFFMTLKALHLGVVKVLNDGNDSLRQLGDATRMQQEMEQIVQHATPNTAEALRAQARLNQVRTFVDNVQTMRLCQETILGDQEFLGEVLAFYRLVAAWLLRMACPSGMPTMPLPEPAPMEFKTLPEHFVEDLIDVLLYASRTYPQLVASQRMEDMVVFITVFMGSPTYVRSPYLRSKLSEVIHVWLPPSEQQPTPGRWQRRAPGSGELAYLLEGHPLVLQSLVPSLLALYADIEYTDRANQFYIKYSMRQYIGDILQHLWNIPAHKDAWKAFAALEGGRGPYLRFCNMLINDSIYLLNESLTKLTELRELETLLSDPMQVATMPPQERQEREEAQSRTGEHLRSLLYLAGGTIATLSTSTKEVQAPLLLPEMVERIANMLNFFLLYLTGPERKSLKVKDPEKYNFQPKQLLASIIRIYLHIAAADSQGVFAAAIAADARSYREQMFPEAAMVLRQTGVLSENDLLDLEALAARVAAAASQQVEEEENLGEVPDEFLDPIMGTLMVDPVTLPTSSTIMDRATIARHLLSDSRDPINRKPLTPDMLLPNDELRQRIAAWKQERRSQRMVS